MNVRTSLDRLLCLFAPVEAGEGLTALLLMMNLFLLSHGKQAHSWMTQPTRTPEFLYFSYASVPVRPGKDDSLERSAPDRLKAFSQPSDPDREDRR